jgi:hypothetical protein
MTSEFLPLGCVMRLAVEPDTTAGKIDDLLRDRLEFEIMQKLLRLPADTDLERLRAAAAADVEKLRTTTEAIREGHGNAAAAADADFAVIAVAMLIRAASADGGLFAGFRWKLVPRGQVDKAAFIEEARAADYRMARWLAH